jgi:hypothetical protein
MTPSARLAPPGAGTERVGVLLALLLLFVPVFYILLYFRRYSWLARAGWGVWLGLIVFVKLSGLADPVLRIDVPAEADAPAPPFRELPLKDYLDKLLGAQFMDSFSVDGQAVTLVYSRQDGYFGEPEVLADLGISNGYSLLYRRGFQAVTLRFPGPAGWRQMRLTREGFRGFFGLDEAALAGAQPPIGSVPAADKARFVARFLR